MDKTSVAEALRTLADSKSRSETSRLREVFAEVEAALSAGVSRSAILETLHEQDFKMTAKSFESALYRLRKQRNAGQLEKPKNVHMHEGIPAAKPQFSTPEETEDKPPDEGTLLTAKQRRELRADKYVRPESQTSNPLLKSIMKKEQAK